LTNHDSALWNWHDQISSSHVISQVPADQRTRLLKWLQWRYW